jgi:hypothetical protein
MQAKRPWAGLRCDGCGRRAAKLYLGDGLVFACRLCRDLGYASQLENRRYRAITKARKLRVRLGGSGNLLDPFPKRPRGMHRRTYDRLQAAAITAEERMLALDLDWLRTHYGVTWGDRALDGSADGSRRRYGGSRG